MPRLFVAIDLPADTKDQILSLREDDLPPGRWSRRAALHLTLHFIGDVPEGVARAYQRVLGNVDAAAFDLRLLFKASANSRSMIDRALSGLAYRIRPACARCTKRLGRHWRARASGASGGASIRISP